MAIIKYLKSFLVVCGAGIVSLAILSLFVLIYGFSGIHIANKSGSTDFKWESKQLKTNMTEGFSWIRLDTNGFNNPDDADSVEPDILIMGSSHMEAIHVRKDQNASAVLSSLLPEYSIYNIGISGHDIYQCAKNIRAAVDEYNPNYYLIIETSTISFSNKKMESVLSGELSSIPSYDSGLLYLVQKYCPAIKSIYKHVDDWRKSDKRSDTGNSVSHGSEMNVETLNDFLAFMSSSVPDTCKLIIIYHPTTGLDAQGHLVLNSINDNITVFKSSCEKNGIIFVDTSESIANLYDEKHILAHGFINTAVGVGHLNEYGHRAIAESLAEVIMEDQK